LKLLVTGGCGFIGSNFIRLVIDERPEFSVVNLDALTYAGNPENLRGLGQDGRHQFAYGSIVDVTLVRKLMSDVPDAVINFAAESHVDRSLQGSLEFVRTNVDGTAVLLEAARWAGVKTFVQISTDEVYGSLGDTGKFKETTPIHPNNPYSATKAAADHLALAYAHTFGLDVRITRSSNNYGPRQYPEKLIPLHITNAMAGKPIPVYGDGLQIRDWLYVDDNCRGILAVLEKGRAGHVYNLGGGNERTNLAVAREILILTGRPKSLIEFVQDRPGHDRRYAIDCSKAKRELGWAPETQFEDGLAKTVAWYETNQEWILGVEKRKTK
jgi:dTDP-glucose 4,6-dehydratase